MHRIAPVALASLVSAAALVSAASLAAAAPAPVRLPDVAAPTRYSVRLSVDPEKPAFTGVLDLELAIRRATSIVTLNGTSLDVGKAWFDVDGRRVTAGATTAGPNDDTITFTAASTLPAGPARLHVEYRGIITDNEGRGLFHEKEGGRWYAATQLEAIYARRVFPCFDEPAYKTPWQVTLEVERELVALSNTPVQSEEPLAGNAARKVVRFGATRPLPAYLVAFAVGPFDLVDAGHGGARKVPMRIAVPRGRAADAAYAAQLAPQVLDHLEAYLGVPYAYDKLDIFTVPVSDVAMENVGLILAPQSAVVAKPENRSMRFERGFVELMLHEMGHQWFGDLVTCAWWDDTWLNEAFATWITTRLIEEWHPEWSHQTKAQRERIVAMEHDQLMSARSIRQPIRTRDDILNAFDGITYEKGATVLAMLEAWVGPDKWRDGIHKHLESHAHGTATVRDFTAAVSAAAGRPIAPVLDTFVDQPGVPAVSFALSCGGGTPTVAVKQERYLPIGSSGAASAQHWQLPVCVKYGLGGAVERTCALVSEPSATIALDKASRCPDWLLANDGERGYYRASYEGDLLGKLIGGDIAKRLTLPELVGLLNDLSALARNGKLPMAQLLRLLPSLAGDPRREVVLGTATIVEKLRDHMVAPAQLPAYAHFIHKLYGARARKLGWAARPGDDQDTRLLRSHLLPLVADYGGDLQLRAEATRLARAWLRDRKAVSPDLVEAVLETAAHDGDAALFDAFLAEAVKAERTDRERLLETLARFRNPALAERAVALTLDERFDAREVADLPRVARHWETTRGPAWELVRKSFDALVKRLSAETVAGYVTLPASFCDEAHRREGEAFFTPRVASLPGGPRELEQSLEQARLCVQLVAAQAPSVAAFLKAY